MYKYITFRWTAGENNSKDITMTSKSKKSSSPHMYSLHGSIQLLEVVSLKAAIYHTCNLSRQYKSKQICYMALCPICKISPKIIEKKI